MRKAGWQRAGGGGDGRELQEKVAAKALSRRLAGARGDRRRGAPGGALQALGRSATLISLHLADIGASEVGRGLGRPG